MPEEKKDVNDAGSPPATKDVNDNGSPPLNQQAELKAKTEKIARQEAEIASYQERLVALEEKERTRELTAREERERAGLEGDLKSEARKLRALKETQPWIEVAREEAEKAGETKAFEVSLNLEIEKANEQIEDWAKESGKTPKELANELLSYVGKYQDKRPTRRNELAFRDFQADQSKLKSLSEREKALKAKEDADTKFREGAGRFVRDESFHQKLENADSAKARLRLMRDRVQTDASE